MADGIYNRGLDEMAAWTTSTYKALLLKSVGYSFDKDHDFVADLTPGSNEITASGYSRYTIVSPTRTINDTTDRIIYSTSVSPAFGTIVAGQTVGAMVLYRFVTNDADSILIGYYDLTDFATDGTPFGLIVGVNGLFYVDQGA